MNLMQPKSDDPQQQQANVILKVLPFMIGWFALNVPAALGVYWVVNNIVTTASTLYVRSNMPKMEPVGGDGAAAASVMESSTVDFNPTPMNDKAVGFGGADMPDGMTTITPIDAEIVDDGAPAVDGLLGPDIPAAPGGSKKVSWWQSGVRLTTSTFAYISNTSSHSLHIYSVARRRKRGGRTKFQRRPNIMMIRVRLQKEVC